jgi:hypothetical protein
MSKCQYIVKSSHPPPFFFWGGGGGGAGGGHLQGKATKHLYLLIRLHLLMPSVSMKYQLCSHKN